MSPYLLIGGTFMSRFKKYNGTDKYHFRVYKKNGLHPFVVAMITEEKTANRHYLISGYMITHDFRKVKKHPHSYLCLFHNPNPNDNAPCYLHMKRFESIKDSCFSKPYPNWHLSKIDEELIDKLERRK